MTREEIVTALRCCAEPGRDCEEDCPMNEISREPCRKVLAPAAADLIENQQREIEALRQANEGLRFNLAALSTPEGKKMKEIITLFIIVFGVSFVVIYNIFGGKKS